MKSKTQLLDLYVYSNYPKAYTELINGMYTFEKNVCDITQSNNTEICFGISQDKLIKDDNMSQRAILVMKGVKAVKELLEAYGYDVETTTIDDDNVVDFYIRLGLDI